MNQRLRIYTRGTSLNSLGELSSVYTQSGSVWGRAKHYVDGQRIVSDKEKPQHKVEVVARHFSGTTGDQIEYNGYRWEIEGVRRNYRSSVINIIANRLYPEAAKYYLQPNGTNFYLTPSGDKYLQP